MKKLWFSLLILCVLFIGYGCKKGKNENEYIEDSRIEDNLRKDENIEQEEEDSYVEEKITEDEDLDSEAEEEFKEEE